MPILIANWKMNHGAAAAQAFVHELTEHRALLKQAQKGGVLSWFAPPLVSLGSFAELQRENIVALGSQNVHWKDSGAFTGEVSRPMLAEAGCTFAIVGHSERRHQLGENDEQVLQRALANLVPGFKVVFCIGENLEARKGGQTNAVLSKQLRPLIKSLTPTLAAQLVIAYEPVWAIGTGVAAENNDIASAHKFIREECGDFNPPILYGGSVTAKNLSSILSIPNVGGVLVGSASLTVAGWIGMVEAAMHIKGN